MDLGDQPQVRVLTKQNNKMDFQRECVEAWVALLALSGGRVHGGEMEKLRVEGRKGSPIQEQCQASCLSIGSEDVS